MPPSLALLVWLVLLFGLLRYDPAKDSKTSLALWVPVIWIFILASRLPSQWLGGLEQSASQAMEEGNSLDRSIFILLILLSLGILMSRSFNWGAFFARNAFFTAFIFFGLLSVFWSDFTFVAFKRWFRDFGNYLVILVVLSDPNPPEAVRTMFRHLCYLLVPLSIVLIKYYPQIGISYEVWSGAPMYVGATTSKNMLGVACLVIGIFFFWDIVSRWPDRKERRIRRIIFLDFVFLGMTVWLLHLSNSATSRLCLALGCLVIAAAHTKAVKRHPAFLKILIPVCLCAYMVLEFGFDINAKIAAMVGRDPTLTGRTDLWVYLLSMHTNPLFGTGYESFWLGSRLEFVWRKYWLFNEAHNGYLEVYLNLGLIGLFLLTMFLIASYRRIWKLAASSVALSSLSLGVWAVTFFYNMTEAGFRGGMLWMSLVLGALAVPERTEDRLTDFSRKTAPGAPRHSFINRGLGKAKTGTVASSGLQPISQRKGR